MVPYAVLDLRLTVGREVSDPAFLRVERRVTEGVEGISCSEIEGEAAERLLRVERLVVDMAIGRGSKSTTYEFVLVDNRELEN